MTPRERAQRIQRAKQVAVSFASAVRQRNAHRTGVITREMDREDLAALCVVLAEATDGMRLRSVTETSDDGMPESAAATGEAAA
jgi:hypothetical protein